MIDEQHTQYTQYTQYTSYARLVLSGEITACQYIKQACSRYLSWFDRPEYEFRPEAVDKYVNFCAKLKHYTGKSAGQPFKLSPFQFWIACNIFGFYNKETDERVVKNVYIEMARKQGKSFFAASICLYCLIADGESAAEVELVANSAKQAGILFRMCHTLCSNLDKKHKFLDTYRDSIKFDKTHSVLQVLSSDAGNNDGWNSSCYVIDEYHAAPDSSMYDVMKSSQGMRSQPLAIVITTAGFNLFGPCYAMRTTCCEILSGVKVDDSQFAAIYELDRDDDWKDESVWEKANPNIDITVKRSYLQEQVLQATNQPSMEVPVRTKNFNQWMSSSDVWIQNDILLSATQDIDISTFKDRICYGGVDLSAVSDLTAFSLMTVVDDNEEIKYFFKTYYYLPESCLYDNPNSEVYKQWKRHKLITITPGNVVDYDYLTEDILRLVGQGVLIEKIAYDQYNATQFAINCTEQGLPLEPYAQSLWNFNRPTKEFERLIKSGKVVLDNNEITRWCFSNVALKVDHNDNVKPIKGGTNMGKIDGVISCLEALGTYLGTPHYDNQIMTI